MLSLVASLRCHMTELFTVWLTKGAMIDNFNQLTSCLNNSSVVGVKIFDKMNKIYSSKILTSPNFIKIKLAHLPKILKEH